MVRFRSIANIGGTEEIFRFKIGILRHGSLAISRRLCTPTCKFSLKNNSITIKLSRMFAEFAQRSLELEHLDKGDYSPEEYEGCIIELQRVNRWLGDARALRLSLLADLEDSQLQRFSVLAVAAGSGELSRVAAQSSRRKKLNGPFTGL